MEVRIAADEEPLAGIQFSLALPRCHSYKGKATQ